MKIDAEYKQKLLNQIYYYNDDSWELLDEYPEIGGNVRAICANIAYCLVDKDRFLEYYNRSEFWKRELTAALSYYRDRKYVDDYKNLKLFYKKSIEEADSISYQIEFQFLYDIQNNILRIDYTNKDIGTVDTMLFQPSLVINK